MKISMRKFDILLIFVAILSIETISFATIQKVVETENDRKNEMLIQEADAVLSDEEKETLDLINEYRKANGLDELKPLANLQAVAKLKADDLVNNDYFAHTSPVLGTPFEMLKDNGIEYKVAGENLAGNTTPERATDAWINSPAHRDNILDDGYEYTGICVVESEIYGRVYVQLFMGI